MNLVIGWTSCTLGLPLKGRQAVSAAFLGAFEMGHASCTTVMQSVFIACEVSERAKTSCQLSDVLCIHKSLTIFPCKITMWSWEYCFSLSLWQHRDHVEDLVASFLSSLSVSRDQINMSEWGTYCYYLMSPGHCFSACEMTDTLSTNWSQRGILLWGTIFSSSFPLFLSASCPLSVHSYQQPRCQDAPQTDTKLIVMWQFKAGEQHWCITATDSLYVTVCGLCRLVFFAPGGRSRLSQDRSSC